MGHITSGKIKKKSDVRNNETSVRDEGEKIRTRSLNFENLCRLVSCKMNNVYGRPGPNSIWATTALGDVFVYDPVIAEVRNLFFFFSGVLRNSR